ncbi:MAG: PDZ domain-containing protein [Actinobacteria bacterium]|nr:PDZ domain-containing protein [Actinomycetota bacterium]MDQ3425334.1 PDZ domain-containing protein [Actinomycetota bacterium]
MKRFAGILVALGLIGLAAAFTLWILPAEEFIFTPGNAKPLAERVTVEGARPIEEGDVYYVDVFVRRTTRLEDLLPFLRPEGSTVVPEQALLPAGTSEAERDRQTAAEMSRSELVASAVALRALGQDVVAKPQGALVIDVASDVPAAAEIDSGDVIVAVDGVAVQTPDELRREIGRRKPRDEVELTLQRDDETLKVTVKTVASPEDPNRAIVGIRVDQQADIEVPIDIDIDLGRVGGPSAGLPFALEIARALGRDVTHGCNIAATGELALDGTVLSVGGLRQKTIAARNADVDAFVVPAGANAEEARQHAGDLEVIPVESFQQALRTLTTTGRKC